MGEACIVELADGAVYMNNRNHDPRSLGYRSWCISRDGGESFTEFGVDRTLIEGRCHAALARYPASAQQGGGPILFSNPASFEGVNQLHTREIGSATRRDLTVRVSYDECRSWPVARRIDEDAGYSSLVVLDDGTRTFCACCSITSQLTTGARRPMPMKLSRSPRIMPGTARTQTGPAEIPLVKLREGVLFPSLNQLDPESPLSHQYSWRC